MPKIYSCLPMSLAHGDTWSHFDRHNGGLRGWAETFATAKRYEDELNASGTVLWTPHVPPAGVDPDTDHMRLSWRDYAVQDDSVMADRDAMLLGVMTYSISGGRGLWLFAGRPPLTDKRLRKPTQVSAIIDYNLGPIVDPARSCGILRGICYDGFGDHAGFEVNRSVVTETRRMYPRVLVGAEPRPRSDMGVRFSWYVQTRQGHEHTRERRDNYTGPRIIFYNREVDVVLSDVLAMMQGGWDVGLQREHVDTADLAWQDICDIQERTNT